MAGWRCAVMAALLAPAVPSAVTHAQLDAAAAASARATTAENPPQPPDLDDAIRRLAVAGRFVQVPLSGRIGADVMPEGFEALAERRAALRGAKAFVVEIDSDSGSNAAAMRIAEALLSIGEEVPVILVVHRAIGPAALLLVAGHRVLVPEPAPSSVIIAIQPEVDPLAGLPISDSVTLFTTSLAPLLERSPRRASLASVTSDPSRWQLTARDAYAAGIAEPLEGGVGALGRLLRIDPWVSAGRQVDELLRRRTIFSQQLELYRARTAARAFASLEAANAAVAQVPAVEQAAVAIDPRVVANQGTNVRAQFDGRNWIMTPSSVLAWQKSCDAAAAAWLRVPALCEAAQQQVRVAHTDLAALLTSAAQGTTPVLNEAVHRLEREVAEVEARVAAVQDRCRAARDEAAALAALRHH